MDRAHARGFARGCNGVAVFEGRPTNIDASQASQGLAGGKSFPEAKGSWGWPRDGRMPEKGMLLLRLLLREELNLLSSC